MATADSTHVDRPDGQSAGNGERVFRGLQRASTSIPLVDMGNVKQLAENSMMLILAELVQVAVV